MSEHLWADEVVQGGGDCCLMTDYLWEGSGNHAFSSLLTHWLLATVTLQRTNPTKVLKRWGMGNLGGLVS